MASCDVKRTSRGRFWPWLLCLLASCSGHVPDTPYQSLHDLREVTPSAGEAISANKADVEDQLGLASPNHVSPLGQIRPEAAERSSSQASGAAVAAAAIAEGTSKVGIVRTPTEVGVGKSSSAAGDVGVVTSAAAVDERRWGLVHPEQSRPAKAVPADSVSVGRVTSVPTQMSASGIVSGVVAPTFGSFGQGSSWVATSSTPAPSLIRRADHGRQATHMLEERARKAAIAAAATAAVSADGSVDAGSPGPMLSSRMQGNAPDPAWEAIPITDDPSSPVVARHPSRSAAQNQEESPRSIRDYLPGMGSLVSVAARGEAQVLGMVLILLCLASRSEIKVEKHVPDKVAAIGRYIASPAAARSLLARASSRDYGAVSGRIERRQVHASSPKTASAMLERSSSLTTPACASAGIYQGNAAPSRAASASQGVSEDVAESDVDEVTLFQRQVAALEREVSSLSARLTQGKGMRPEVAPEGSISCSNASASEQTDADWRSAAARSGALEVLRRRLEHLEKEKVSLRRLLSFAGTWSSVGSSSSRFVVS
mmetsp:Transcript_24246/g.52772  ORF Transcript_24246/g.52772 Transcript_24246/m.52772 type:complete len:541 (-) Transcript_24246:166-1788(-)